MKEAIIKINGNQYKITTDCEEKYNQVIIYKLIGNTPSPIYSGVDLKSACRKWLDKVEDAFALIWESFEHWACEVKGECLDKIKNVTTIEEIENLGRLYDEYIESIDEVELFLLLTNNNPNYTYYSWQDKAIQ